MSENIIIGLTGRFGSGCTTTYNFILSEFNTFKGFSLSNYLREVAKEDKKYQKASEKNKREYFQDLGDKLRKKYSNGYIAQEIIKRIESLEDKNVDIVVDSFKNPAEVNEFRKKFTNFYLFAIDAETETRWERVKNKYDKDRKTFELDDERDKGSDEEPFKGQQVGTCIKIADVLINNEKSFYRPDGVIDKNANEYGQKVNRYITLIRNPGERTPMLDELYMHQACSIALSSRCLKRQVGAVIVRNNIDKHKDNNINYVLATGCNNVPDGEESCIDCYRDIELSKIIDKIKFCSHCGERILKKEDYKCLKCGNNFYIPKLLDLCRAVHAEENAIIQAAKLGISVDETKLYTSTHPCLLCSKKIINSGIKSIVYLEPYPMIQSEVLLKNCKIEVRKFEGVTSKAFNKLFSKEISS